jgi:hypothetical protein
MSAQTPRSEGGPVQPDDLEVTLAVRRDLGAEHDQAVIGEFLDRVGSAIDERVDARVHARTAPLSQPGPERQPSIALGIVSILSGIAGTAIVLGITAGSTGGIVLTTIVWAAIAAVNITYTRRV